MERYGFNEVTLTDRGVYVHVITKEYDDEFQAFHSS